jgi:hypothetical protein
MLSLDDKRWSDLRGAYRTPYDPRPEIRSLREESCRDEAWKTLWNELHHQGDVDIASYAAVPHLAAFYAESGKPDWNAYALVGCIEVERTRNNPEVPDWLQPDYDAALSALAEHASREVLSVSDPLIVRSALGLIALSRGLRLQGELLLFYGEDELAELIPG